MKRSTALLLAVLLLARTGLQGTHCLSERSSYTDGPTGKTRAVRPSMVVAVGGLVLADGRALSGTRPAGRRGTGRIIFSSDRSGAWRIWVVNSDGSGMRQMTQAEPGEDDVDPVWSPDGKSFLFTSTRGGRTGIWRKSVDPPAGGPERICEGDQAEWSPDGAQIVFRRDGRLLTHDLTSGRERTITPPAGGWLRCSGPSWSPDGRTIAFACRWDAGNVLFTVASAGGEPTKVYDKEGACEPHWSGDGEHLVYETETHICTITREGTKNRLITYFGGLQRYARWSPDGKELVFCQGTSERGPWELYVIPAGGGTPRKLTEGGSDMYPDWR